MSKKIPFPEKTAEAPAVILLLALPHYYLYEKSMLLFLDARNLRNAVKANL